MSMTPQHNVKMPLRYVADTHIKERPLAFVDLEFSGLRAENEILQIGCVLVSQPDFSVIGEWQIKVRPEHIENGDQKSLKIIGYDEQKWADAVPLKEALEGFNVFAKDAVLIGYNVVGDFFQLKKSFHSVGVVPTYHWQVLDVQSMIFAELYQSELTGFRMREVVKEMHVENAHWHDALADARVTYDIFKKMMDHINRRDH